MDTRLLGALLLAPLALLGCAPRTVEVKAEQPIQFNHKAHISYFLSGKHKEEGIERHRKAGVFDKIEEAPDDLLAGNCASCHDNLAVEKPDCARCHTLVLENPSIRERKDQRPCIMCHQGTWKGNTGRIPSVATCGSCHAEKARTDSVEEKRLRGYLERKSDIPWVQVHTTAPSVYFSHPAHVRYVNLACTTCHEDMSKRTTPPTTAREFTMTSCIACHTKMKATTDCIGCHK